MTSDRAVQLVGAGIAASWLMLLVVLDIATAGASFVLAPLFALSPLVACSVLSARGTSLFAAAAVAATVASGWWNDTWDQAQHVVRIGDVLLVSAAAVVVAVVRVRRERRYARVVVIAEIAQKAILPTLPDVAGKVAIGARYMSASQDAVVGGDLYDCYHSERHVRFLVGDVRGKGLAAVEQAARVIRSFRQSAATEATLPAVARDMTRYLAPFFDDEEFVTSALVDTSDPQRLTLVSCGHPPPMLVSRDGRVTFLEAPAGLPLGLGDRYDALSVPWAPGDRVLLYTDGLSEARDADGEFLPLHTLAPQLSSGPVEEALDNVLDTVRRHVPHGDLNDDLAVILLENAASDQERTKDAQARPGAEAPAFRDIDSRTLG
ncbi:MAG TPA: PP2C family protein-serine/threonine phosphatase [Nocardioidaceae bacterium]|nr:PP2C family protein-serine/threonine phosphatase [Nocardioidaceae bacterium]